MKALAKKITSDLLNITKGWPIKNIYGGNLQILMFHRVVRDIGNNRISNHGIEVTDVYLENLIRFYLNENYTPISINDINTIDFSKTNTKYVVFTFDDGYKDNLTIALPIFEKYKLPFTIYVTTDFVFGNEYAWWYAIEDIIRINNEVTITINNQQVVINCKQNKEEVFNQLRLLIQKDKSILKQLENNYQLDISKYKSLFLNQNDLLTLAKHPLVTIGAHTVSHPSISKLDDESAYLEISKSKQILEEILNISIEHFSYPFGTVNDCGEREAIICEKAGYKTAVTTCYGDYKKLNKNDFFFLKRIWTSETNDIHCLQKSVWGINNWSIKKI